MFFNILCMRCLKGDVYHLKWCCTRLPMCACVVLSRCSLILCGMVLSFTAWIWFNHLALSHKHVVEFQIWFPLQRLCEEVNYYIIGLAVLDIKVTTLHSVLDKKLTYINMPGITSAQVLPVSFHPDCTLVFFDTLYTINYLSNNYDLKI